MGIFARLRLVGTNPRGIFQKSCWRNSNSRFGTLTLMLEAVCRQEWIRPLWGGHSLNLASNDFVKVELDILLVFSLDSWGPRSKQLNTKQGYDPVLSSFADPSLQNILGDSSGFRDIKLRRSIAPKKRCWSNQSLRVLKVI